MRSAAAYDKTLGISAYRLREGCRDLPWHFHEEYVIGLMESGKRRFLWGSRAYPIHRGAILLLNPGESHACARQGEEPLDFCSFSIRRETMATLAKQAGWDGPAVFGQPVVREEEIAALLRSLHRMVMAGEESAEREALLILTVGEILRRWGQMPKPQPCRQEVAEACKLIEERYPERLRLEDLCRRTGTSSSTLLRAFLKEKGITPYRYLENIRIREAQRLLRQGASPLTAALETGFSDQSHFTNRFGSITGLAPGVYQRIFRDKAVKQEEEQQHGFAE